MTTANNIKTVKRTFWGAAGFYFLIAFEFFYMASPFAAYFYSVYRPALNFFNETPILAGLVTYFMPHFTETSSAFINSHNIIGGILAVSGFLAFCVGACQVYYHKLARKGAVTGGIYNLIRHPQYASFIICSFGLLLLWPRYIVLIMFITMLFAYYFLARVEEQECEAKFGQSYTDYKNRTGMFLPLNGTIVRKLASYPKSRAGRVFAGFGIYILIMTLAIVISAALNNLTVNSLYAVYKDNSANISVSKIEQDQLQKVISIVQENKGVQARLEKAGKEDNTKYLNYILPKDWYAAEIPMNSALDRVGHLMPSDYDRNAYKMILTKANIRNNTDVAGKEIISNIVGREPIVEVWVDMAEQKVTRILEMPENIWYENIPVALY